VSTAELCTPHSCQVLYCTASVLYSMRRPPRRSFQEMGGVSTVQYSTVQYSSAAELF